MTGAISQDTSSQFLVTGDFDLLEISNNAILILLISGFLGGLISLFLVVKVIHRKAFVHIVTAAINVRWNRIIFAFTFWIILTALAELAMYLSDPANYVVRFSGIDWFLLLLIGMFLMPIQTSFEELFMRGYLLQAFFLLGKHPWIPIIMTSLLFGLLHLANPEVKQFGLITMMTYYIGVGIFLAVLTVLDEGLELALGIHAATNFYGAVFVNFSGSAITTDALVMVQQVDADILLLFFVISMALFLFIGTKIYRWDWKMLGRRIVHTNQQIPQKNVE